MLINYLRFTLSRVIKMNRLIVSSLSAINSKKFSINCVNMQRVENVLIIGSGIMGSGIAQSCAMSGKFNSVTLQDVSDVQLENAKNRIEKTLTKMNKQKIVENISFESVMNRITLTKEMRPLNDKNLLIIETIPEIIDLKQKIFKELCESFKNNKETIFVTNTSSMLCHEIGKFIDCKERYAGLHFFNPVPVMKLVEIIRLNDGTNDNTYNTLVQFVKDIDKVSIMCKDTPGFIVNRLLAPYLQNALQMLERGDATARDIDTAMKLGAGYLIGPFELIDHIGLDTYQHIVDVWIERGDYDYVSHRSKLIDSMVERGHFGKKSGKGFYDYKL